MSPIYFSLGLLAVLFLIQIFHKSGRTHGIHKCAFWGTTLAVILYYFYLVYAQYTAWRDGGELLKHLVPPYRSIAYVFGYQFTRFALHYLISLFVAVLFLQAAKYFNKKYNFRFFEEEEPYLGAISIFLLGDPGWNYAWIYYLVGLLAVSVTGSLVVNHLLKKSERFSLRFLWLPAAILIALLFTAT